MSDKKIRVRFAPSPTGPLHCGGLRTALYNYLFAKKLGGDLILRIEDTDQTRFVEGAEQYIMDSFAWLGIEFDESPEKEGAYGPYKQSVRKSTGIYSEYVNQLIDKGFAYYAFDSQESLELKREEYKLKKANFSYNCYTRDGMSNSLTLPADVVKQKLESGDPYVVRFKVPRKEEVKFHDIIRGFIVVNTDTIDDKVLMKSDGMPTYHLANIVDDHLMEISHVIRGEEWLPSAPFHVLLYRAFGWETPEFAHLPLLLAPSEEGTNKKEKLSKRHGDKYGFPIFGLSWEYVKPEEGTTEKITGYKETGYLKEAVLNFLLLQGWHPGGDKEKFSLEEAIAEFDLEKVGKAGVQFDYKKLNWFNAQYLHALPTEELIPYFIEELKNVKSIVCTEDQARVIIPMAKERALFKKDLIDNVEFFFVAPKAFKEELYSIEVLDVLSALSNKLRRVGDVTGEDMKHILFDIIKEKEYKNGQILKPLRDAITGRENGPELHNIFQTIGKREVISRMENYLEYMKYVS